MQAWLKISRITRHESKRFHQLPHHDSWQTFIFRGNSIQWKKTPGCVYICVSHPSEGEPNQRMSLMGQRWEKVLIFNVAGLPSMDNCSFFPPLPSIPWPSGFPIKNTLCFPLPLSLVLSVSMPPSPLFLWNTAPANKKKKKKDTEEKEVTQKQADANGQWCRGGKTWTNSAEVQIQKKKL